MNKKPTRLAYTTILFMLVVSIAIPTLHSTGATTATLLEFSLPIPEAEGEDWNTLVGVGTVLRYPPDWQGQPYQAQGNVRDGATYEFIWTDERGVAARIDMLEIVEPDVGKAAMASEMSHWREHSGHRVEPATVQGHSAWWIQMQEPQSEPPWAMSFAELVWIDYGERVYRLRLRCRAEAEEEGKRVLRQMLSTLEMKAIDWSLAAESLLGFSGGEAMNAANTPSALAGVPYDRSAAYDYAETYWNELNNDDGCYLWYNGSTLDCTYHAGDWGVDGAHFVNRAVRAGGRPIPGLWDGAALRVTDLRNWLQSDGVANYSFSVPGRGR